MWRRSEKWNQIKFRKFFFVEQDFLDKNLPQKNKSISSTPHQYLRVSVFIILSLSLSFFLSHALSCNFLFLLFSNSLSLSQSRFVIFYSLRIFILNFFLTPSFSYFLFALSYSLSFSVSNRCCSMFCWQVKRFQSKPLSSLSVATNVGDQGPIRCTSSH